MRVSLLQTNLPASTFYACSLRYFRGIRLTRGTRNALGARARNLSQGILTVRFEMPFAVWCGTCPNPTIVGQGVRFNAEKEKVGNYYSTPIYSFRMKHAPCGGVLEIRTDPKNTAYVVTKGGKKRDTGEDKELDGEIVLKTQEERERLRNDAFAALECKVVDKKQAETDHSRIRELAELRERDWADPYSESQKLRRTLRRERREREQIERRDEVLKERMSLGVDLLAEAEEDRLRAASVKFGSADSKDTIKRIHARALFTAEEDRNQSRTEDGEHSARKRKNKKHRDDAAAAAKRELFQKEVKGNTLAKFDPFLLDDYQPRLVNSDKRPLAGMKRKQHPLEQSSGDRSAPDTNGNLNLGLRSPTTMSDSGVLPLVEYDSD